MRVSLMLDQLLPPLPLPLPPSLLLSLSAGYDQILISNRGVSSLTSVCQAVLRASMAHREVHEEHSGECTYDRMIFLLVAVVGVLPRPRFRYRSLLPLSLSLSFSISELLRAQAGFSGYIYIRTHGG